MSIFRTFDDFILHSDNLYVPRVGNGVTTTKVIDRIVDEQRMILVRFCFDHNQRFLMVMTPDGARTRTIALEDTYGDVVFMEETTEAEKMTAIKMIQEYKMAMSMFV